MPDKFRNKYRIPSARAPWHDYKGGAYFVTICTKDRELYFGQIHDGNLTLSDIGHAAERCIEEIPEHFSNVEVPVSIVMPNHIHAIIIINDMDYESLVPPVETQHLASHLASHETIKHEKETQNIAFLQDGPMQKFGPQSGNLASVVRGFKIGVTKYANAQGLSFGWQPRFHDHIIRDITEMNVIASYIENNVGRWKEDCYNNPITANASANTDFQQYF